MPPRRSYPLVVVVALGLLAGGGGEVGTSGPTGTPIPVPEVVVRSGSDSLPAGCGAVEAARLVTDFLDAFNRGDAPALARAFPAEVAYPNATKRGFQWYSVTDQNGHFVTHDPAELQAYFAARHGQRERLRLLRLEVSRSWHPGVAIAYRLVRQADDVPAHDIVGKGAIDCVDGTIFVWSMAQAGLEDVPVRATPRP